jgi:hypothetical protein
MSNDIVTRLRDCSCVPHGELCREAADEIEQLRNERDEAQRLYCAAVEEMERGLSNDNRRDVAKALGWDCYDNYTEEEVTDDGNAEF